MEEEAFHRLFSADKANAAPSETLGLKVRAGMRLARRNDVLWRAVAALVIVAFALAALTAGYLLVATVLPPPSSWNTASVMAWAPLAALAVLLMIGFWFGLTAIAGD